MKWLEGINLEKELAADSAKNKVLDAYLAFLKRDDKMQEDLELRMQKSGSGEIPKLNFDLLEGGKIVSEEQIRNSCTEYRLRFLDSKYFKAPIPQEAFAKLKQLQRQHNVEFTQFKILAPASLFTLEFKDKDPLLFVPIGGGYYYLVHRWGGELNPFRKLLMFPFRSFKTLFGSVAGLAALIALSIPSSVMMGPYDKTSLGIRVIFFFYLLLAFCGLTALYGFSRLKNFNSELWNSPYMD